MSTTIMPGFQQDWNCQEAPSSTIVLGQGGTLYVGDRIINTETNFQYRCVNVGPFDGNTTYTGCEFTEITDASSFAIVAASIGWAVNTTRGYTQRNSPAFNTSYTPSTTNDTKVIVNFSMTYLLGSLTTVNGELNSGNGFQIIVVKQLSFGLSSVLGSITQGDSFELYVPAGCSYQISQVANGGGSNSLVSIWELSM
jgi:hypothetical protein